MFQRFFTKNELNGLLTSNFYSILYYNSDIWLILLLSPQLKQQLLSASFSELKKSSRNYDNMMSFDQLHISNKRATPLQYMAYKHSLLLHKIFNNSMCTKDWLSLNFQQTFNVRNNFVNLVDTLRLKVGKNIAINRLKIVNGKIPYYWLNLTWNTFKVK